MLVGNLSNHFESMAPKGAAILWFRESFGENNARKYWHPAVLQRKRAVSAGCLSNHFESMAPKGAGLRRFHESVGVRSTEDVLKRESEPGIILSENGSQPEKRGNTFSPQPLLSAKEKR